MPAADPPRQGHATGKVGWFADGRVYEIDKGIVVFVGAVNGTYLDDANPGVLHGASVSCPTMIDIDPVQTVGSGRCAVTDRDGDKAFFTYRCDGGPPCRGGKADWTHGTGKYTGIAGQWSFDAFGPVPTQFGATGWSVWNLKWRLP